MEGDEQLRQRFEKEILPKIQEQLKALDKNEQPNTTTIELKRQLRVSSSLKHHRNEFENLSTQGAGRQTSRKPEPAEYQNQQKTKTS